jgi:hypothetical protein
MVYDAESVNDGGLIMTENDQRPIGAHRAPEPDLEPSADILGGDEGLEIVGEASYQDALWAICGGLQDSRIRKEITAILVPEPDNPVDPNAIAVHIAGKVVGYLARDDASRYLPGLRDSMDQRRGYVELKGEIVGGGFSDDGPARLGVWLRHDPRDFGVASSGGTRRVGPAARPVNVGSTMRTGFSEAWITDLDDDTYDLSWFNDLPKGDQQAIAELRGLLSTDPDPIDRHFQFTELETRLYRSRDRRTRRSRSSIRPANSTTLKWKPSAKPSWRSGERYLLDTYRQMAIRQQKLRDWNACIWWAERGLALYGNNAAREDAVEDLLTRRNRALSKLEAKRS